MSIKTYALVSGFIFAVIAIVHAWRIYTGTIITFRGAFISMEPSWVALFVAGILAFYGLMFATRS